MYSFKIQSIVFEDNSWRKLSKLSIKIAPRLTLIAGANGIGKSTILGLLVNCCGTTGSTSYVGGSYSPEFDELFTLTPDDLNKKRANITFNVDDGQKRSTTPLPDLIKGCNVSYRDTENKTLRVVPRTLKVSVADKNELVIDGKSRIYGVGPDQKVPIPTLYVGMSRVWPIGEANSEKVSSQYSEMELEDQNFIYENVMNIIPFDKNKEENVVELSIAGLGRSIKRARHPQYKFDAKAISLGQGALGSILTALASFRKLKRELKTDYFGGLLAIDEVDAGLHPSAQKKLIDVLKKQARDLNLQIVMTSHSMPVIEALDYDISKKQHLSPDLIVYLADTFHPKVCYWDAHKIKNELYLQSDVDNNNKDKEIFVLTEDAEAKEFLSTIKSHYTSKFYKRNIGAKVTIQSLDLGCNQLIKLANHKALKKQLSDTIFVVDADVSDKKLSKSMLRLPTLIDNSNNPPEKELYDFVVKCKNNEFQELHEDLVENSLSSDQIEEHFLKPYREKIKTQDRKDREKVKEWYKNTPEKDRAYLLKQWVGILGKKGESFTDSLVSLIKSKIN